MSIKKLLSCTLTAVAAANPAWAFWPDCLSVPPMMLAADEETVSSFGQKRLVDCLTQAGMSEEKGRVDLVVGDQSAVDRLFVREAVDAVVVGADSQANSLVVVAVRSFVTPHEMDVLKHFSNNGLYSDHSIVSEVRRMNSDATVMASDSFPASIDQGLLSQAMDYQDIKAAAVFAKNQVPRLSHLLTIDCE